MIVTKKRLKLLLTPWVLPGKLYDQVLIMLRRKGIIPSPPVVFRESVLAHKYLDGLKGIEIGGAAHNPFGLDTINVDFTAHGLFSEMQEGFCGNVLPVDIEAQRDNLPFTDSSTDFVINSHVLEHFGDPIKAILEWHRVTKDGGLIYMIVPHKERTPDAARERTPLAELITRHKTQILPANPQGNEHMSVWITEDIVELIKYLGPRFQIV